MTNSQNDSSDSLRKRIEARMLSWYSEVTGQTNVNFLPDMQVTNLIDDMTTLITHYGLEQREAVRKEERTKARQMYAKRSPHITRQKIADTLGISRPTLNKWLEDPEQFTVGAIRRLAELEKKKGSI